MVDATQTQIRRGTEAQCEVFVPVEGEVICDLTQDTLRVGDGTRPGGFIMPNGFHIQNQYFTYAEDTGTENALVADLPLAPLALTVGLSVKIRVAVTNTGDTTINLNSLGATGIRKVQAGTLAQLAAGDLSAGIAYDMTYNGTYFVLSTAGGLEAPVAGDTYTIYRDFDGTGSTRADSYPSINYTNVGVRSRNIMVNTSGSVRIYVEHRGEAGAGGSVTMALNGSTLQTWTRSVNTYVARTFDTECSAGDIITVRQRANGEGASAFSAIRNLLIKSDTPSHGAVSG